MHYHPLYPFTGLLGFALATGLAFAKFSRPRARIVFSNVAVIRLLYGQPILMFRLANFRANRIMKSNLDLAFLKAEISTEGESMRRFYDMKLVRKGTPVFALGWTIMHIIDEDRPLYKLTIDQMAEIKMEIIASFTGIDETANQEMMSVHYYNCDVIIFDHRLRHFFF